MISPTFGAKKGGWGRTDLGLGKNEKRDTALATGTSQADYIGGRAAENENFSRLNGKRT